MAVLILRLSTCFIPVQGSDPVHSSMRDWSQMPWTVRFEDIARETKIKQMK
uniref:Uncharacterized protein n=1 Tax=Meloidogyne incognita TaxID=6306 RepID=A0A914LQV4_MELIC